MSARTCLVAVGPGNELCGYPTDGRAADCAAHRRRRQIHGDARGHIPVRRLPSRKPEAMAGRVAVDAATAAVARVRQAYAPVTDRRGRLELA